MIGYRDMAFCPFWEDCKNGNKCGRALTDDVRADAKKWWGKDGAPIFQFMSKPECHETGKQTHDQNPCR